MSLKVWLPLNGNLNNQGVVRTTVTNNGATVDTSGKIGKCYSFSGSNYVTLPTTFLSDFTNEISVCAWINISSWNTQYDSILKMYASDAQWKNSIFAMGRNGTTSRLYFSIANGTSSTQSSCSLTEDQSLNTWYHISCVYNNTDKNMKIYLNGVLKTTYNTTIVPSFSSVTSVGIGGSPLASYGLKGKLNDVRIYNRALSAEEIKEISKGLVLHFPLSDRYIENTTNLITTEDCLSATCYNGATSKYSYGETTNMYKTVGTFQGRKCTKVYNQTSGTGMYPYVYVNNMFTSNGTNAPEYKTLSFDYYTTISTSISPYKLGNGTGTATYKVTNTETKTGTGTNSVTIPVKPNMWNHVEVTFHGTTDADAQWGYIQNNPSHTANTSNYWLFANMQLETKDHATGYAGVNSTRTATTVKDASGFGYNGTITGNLDLVSSGPRYTTATHFSATTQKILIQNLVTTGFSNSYTFSWWGKTNAFSGKMFWGFADGVRLNGIYNGNLWNTGDGSNNPIYKPNTTTQVSTPSLNEWHHFAMVGNGTSCLVYLDGVLWGQAKTYKSISGTKIYFNGWDSTTSYTTDNMAISDFRMYSTALSANDVLSLYNNGAYIDSIGNIHGKIR